MSNNAIIDQIIANADIVKIIGKHVELKRSGNEFKGCCPFHGEKTPSFFVNPQKGLYNCFGCGVAGNALTFLKEYENLTAGEALKELSRQTGIELPKEPINKSHTYKRTTTSSKTEGHDVNKRINNAKNAGQIVASNPKTDNIATNKTLTTNSEAGSLPFDNAFQSETSLTQDNYAHYYDEQVVPTFEDVYADLSSQYEVASQADGSSSLYDLLAQICHFYQDQLAKNTVAKNYFLNRGLTEQTIAEFSLGYAPSGWQHLEQAFPQDIEGLKLLGLVRSSQKGNDFDLLRNRVIFPIRDNQGRIVGFAGRALSDDEPSKYLNSSESPVFHKQSILYGLYEGRKAKAKSWLVVEGYMDVISLHQAGVYGAVASMGTAIAQPQIEKLLQLNPVLTLSFDGDSAGQKAAWRAMEVGLPALSDGKELRFLTLPDNHDPDSYVKSNGVVAMQQQISQAVPLSQYLYASLTRQYPTNNPENRSKILQELSQLTQKLPKGSYGWLLREDIKSRMGLSGTSRRYQAKQAHDALLNFKTQLTPQLHLQLCFLYQPELLGKLENQTINQQLIANIYHQSQAYKVFNQHKKSAHKQSVRVTHSEYSFSQLRFELSQSSTWNRAPFNNIMMNKAKSEAALFNVYKDKCLTWQDIADANLLTLIEWIQRIQDELSQFDVLVNDVYERINAKAHFILGGLPVEHQRLLIQHWATFFNGLSKRLVTDVSRLVTELILQLMLETLQRQQKTLSKNLAELTLCIKHSQAITTWQRQWLQSHEDNQPN